LQHIGVLDDVGELLAGHNFGDDRHAVVAADVLKNLQSVNAQGQAATLAKRGIPDVAGNADPNTGYEVRIDGASTVIGGTSAVAPLWAALLARLNQVSANPAGYVNPLLYQNPGALRDIVSGNNGDFAAVTGWDACTGLGTPNGAALRSVIFRPA